MVGLPVSPVLRRAVLSLAASFLVFAPLFSFAQSAAFYDPVPFNTFNQSPVIQVHGLPFVERGRVLSSAHERYRLISDTANNFAHASRSDESVLFDGETQRLTFSYARGWSENLEWDIQLPYVSHSGGTLDHFIKSWHELFGLPQQGRDSRPRNQLVYRYTRDGVNLVDLTDETAGLGDVRLGGAWQWQRAATEKDPNLALRAQISLPTGDSDKLLGGGGVDIALWCSGDQKQSWFNTPGQLWGGFGVLVLGHGKVLDKQQRQLALFGSLGGGARVSSLISLKLQMDFHTSLYKNSRLAPINSHAVQLIMGGEVHLSRKARLALAVKEDPTVDASPDVVFHMSMIIDTD